MFHKLPLKIIWWLIQRKLFNFRLLKITGRIGGWIKFSISNPKLQHAFFVPLDHFIGPTGGGWAMCIGLGGAGAHNIFSDSRGVGADSRRITTAISKGAFFDYTQKIKAIIFYRLFFQRFKVRVKIMKSRTRWFFCELQKNRLVENECWLRGWNNFSVRMFHVTILRKKFEFE